MVISNNPKISFIVQTLAKLFDIESASDYDTEYFKKNNVSHAKLMCIIEYWIDQSKLIFGEPVTIRKTQSLRDAGVDFIMEFVSSKLKIGFQVKSYGDVQEKGFHKNVNAQITESQRYELRKLIIVIAGNMNDEKFQGQKIRGLIAELEQRTDDYISVIPPEKTLPICQAYKTRRHPLSLVMLDLQDAFKIADGLSKSLSNKNRKVSISIKTNYLNVPKQQDSRDMRFTLKLQPDELDIFDRMENLNITGEVLKFSKDHFSTFTVDGIDQLKNGFQKLEVMPSENYGKLTLNILDDREVLITELEELTFGMRMVGEEAYATLRDKKQKSLLIKLHFVNDIVKISFGINYHDVELNQIRQAIEFMKALEEGKWIRMLIPDCGVDSKFPVPRNTTSSVLDQVTIQLVDALLVIEERSGIKLRIPEKLSGKEIDQIVKISELVTEEVFPLMLTSMQLSTNDARSFVGLFKRSAKYSEFTIPQVISVLDKKIPITITHLVSDYKLKESVEYNLQKIAAADNELVEIKLESTNENSRARLIMPNKG